MKRRRRLVSAGIAAAALVGGGAGLAAGQAPATIRPHVSGALNPAVTEATIDKTVCVANWTDTIRPGLPTRKGYQNDHLVSLSLGGAPSDPANLWFQPLRQARRDDVVESRLHRELCAGQASLSDVQQAIIHLKKRNG